MKSLDVFYMIQILSALLVLHQIMKGQPQKRAMSVLVWMARQRMKKQHHASTNKATIKAVLKVNLMIRFLLCGVSFVPTSKPCLWLQRRNGNGQAGQHQRCSSWPDLSNCRCCSQACNTWITTAQMYGPSRLFLMLAIMPVHCTSMFEILNNFYSFLVTLTINDRQAKKSADEVDE